MQCSAQNKFTIADIMDLYNGSEINILTKLSRV